MIKTSNEINNGKKNVLQRIQQYGARAIKTFAFISIAGGYLWIVGSFVHYQLGYTFPEIKAKEVEAVREEKVDRLQKATEKITTGQQLVDEGLEEKAEIERELKELDNRILKGKLGLE